MLKREVHFVRFNFQENVIPPEIAQTVALQCLNELFPYVQESAFQGDSLKGLAEITARVHEGIDGNSNLRMRRAIHPDAKMTNLDKITCAVQNNEPIPVVVLYGTAKLPNSNNPDDNEADLADFGAIQMLSALDKRVNQWYKPGIRSRLYFEDGVGFWLFGRTPVVNASQESYFDSLIQMDNDFEREFGRNTVEIVRESALLEAKGLDMNYFLEKCAALEPLFREYLYESGELMEAYIDQTEYKTWGNTEKLLGDDYQKYWNLFAENHLKNIRSFKKLDNEGWHGFIPPEMRKFYFDRFRTNANTVEDNFDSLLCYTAHYFSSTLAKAQLKTPFVSLPGDKCDFGKALKLSFIKLAPGIPDPYQSIFQMRAIPKKAVDSCSAPWRSKGGILYCQTGEKARPDLVPALKQHDGVTFPSHVELSSGGNIRSDLVVREVSTDS